jgi:hypothetical protein
VEMPPDNVWCLVQEPPVPSNRWIEHGLPHYGRIYTQDRRLRSPRVRHGHGALPWHVGRTYDQLVRELVPAKTRTLSWITSNLSVLPGHRRRLAFLERLRRSGLDFDLWGRGFTPLNDKWDGLAPYRYAIAIENHAAPDYWTEKVADCFLAGAMPLYFGASNLGDYFPAESFVWIDPEDPQSPRLVAEIIASDRAERHRDALREARRRLLEEHQFFPFISHLIEEQRRTHPAGPSRKIHLPGTPDLTTYYLDNGPLRRAWHGLRRRLGRFGGKKTTG